MSEKPRTSSGGLPQGQKVNLVSLVVYQEGSVVSRTLVDDRAGTVTLFAFDQGQGLSEHTAPYNALLHVLEGEALVTVAGVENRVASGEAILLPAGKPHAVRAATRFKMLLTMVRSGRSSPRPGS
ncbi:MAG TPA: cupin domain-containing protein [Thermoplasmata archaeon]|nr:cupin domain-containing protein [Thermoplasmata archaeon]